MSDYLSFLLFTFSSHTEYVKKESIVLWCIQNCDPRHSPKCQMPKNFQIYFKHIHFLRNQTKKIYNRAKSYTAMLLYLFFDSPLSTCQKKMDNEKWSKAANSSLYTSHFYFLDPHVLCFFSSVYFCVLLPYTLRLIQ